MVDAAYYRRQATTCRTLARSGKRPSQYLLNLADYFEQEASRLEARFAGNKPGEAPPPPGKAAPDR